ncbi:MAG: hypothetical protein PHW44_05500 [Candidatus Omnitrophica bacterium]|nr:hypothetical protein [Candidatus Omnitrophota bacterium]
MKININYMENKSLDTRFSELNDAVSLLEDALQKVKSGDLKYFKVISSQLRALICLGSRSLTPLLINLAKEKNVALFCYGPSTRSSDTDGFTVLKISSFFVGLLPFSPANQKYELNNWLSSPFVRLGNMIYTPNEVIRMVAEKEGGAHYDDKLDEKSLRLKEIVYSGKFKQLEQNLLVQTTEVVIKFGKNILSLK